MGKTSWDLVPWVAQVGGFKVEKITSLNPKP